MTAQGGGAEQNPDKNAYYILWVIFLVWLVGFLAWMLADYQIKVFFIAVRLYELKVLYWLCDLLPSSWSYVDAATSELRECLVFVEDTLTPDNISLELAETISDLTGRYLRYPNAMLLIFFTVVIFKTNVQMRLKHKYTMQTLAQHERENWPQTRVVLKENLLEVDLDTGPWAMCMTPMQFAKKYQLTTVERAPVVGSGFSKMQVPEYKVILDRTRAERAFAMQLGRLWQGVGAMPAHRRAILAIFMARGCRDTKTAESLTAQLARSAATGTLDCTGADELWKKYLNYEGVRTIFKQHAYEFTIFISMLLFAREDGVLASADFLWVKPVDRRLWYIINNVGRQTPAAEVGGIFCHWYTEMALKRPLSVPMVSGAVDALEIALADVIYMPDEQERTEIHKRQEESQDKTVETSE